MKPSTVPTKEDFQLLRVIGRGSFGKVLLVRNKHDRRVYALKILKKATVVARNQVEHTINERKILEEIDFPFLCRLEFAFQTDDKLYLGMQFIAGGLPSPAGRSLSLLLSSVITSRRSERVSTWRR